MSGSDLLARILSDIRDYVRTTAAERSKDIARSVIDTWEKSAVYSRLDGFTSQPKISDATKVSQTTISDWLAMFVRSGLVTEPNEFYGCHRALFSLRELGIDQSTLKRRKMQTDSKGTITETNPSLEPKEGRLDEVESL